MILTELDTGDFHFVALAIEVGTVLRDGDVC